MSKAVKCLISHRLAVCSSFDTTLRPLRRVQWFSSRYKANAIHRNVCLVKTRLQNGRRRVIRFVRFQLPTGKSNGLAKIRTCLHANVYDCFLFLPFFTRWYRSRDICFCITLVLSSKLRIDFVILVFVVIFFFKIRLKYSFNVQIQIRSLTMFLAAGDAIVWTTAS